MVNLKVLVSVSRRDSADCDHGRVSLGAVGFECSSVRRRARLERRCVARRRRHHHEDRYRRGANGDHLRGWHVRPAQSSRRAVPIEGGAAGLQHLRAGRHRPAGQLQPADQRHARGRRDQRAGDGDREHDDGRDAFHRHRPGGRQPARDGAAAQRPPGHRVDLPRRPRDVCAGGRPQYQQEFPDGDDLGRRRPGQRHDLHHGRRHAQRSVQ